MKSTRQGGRLHNVHTRISERDYKAICKVLQKLDITFADYFNRAIHQNGYEELLAYAKQIKKTPRFCKVVIDEQTKESIDQLSSALNNQSLQLRKIGTNLSNLISRLAGTGTISDIHLIDSMKKDLDAALQDVHKTSSRLADLLYDETTIVKTEYIPLDAVQEYLFDLWKD